MSSEQSNSTKPESLPQVSDEVEVEDPLQTTSLAETKSPVLRDLGDRGRTGQSRIGRFEVLRELGSGGMGVVYLARDPEAKNRLLAIKMLRPAQAHEPRSVAWFLKEARHMKRLDHPHLLPVLEVGEEGQTPYYVMPYLERGPLSRLIGKDRPLGQELCLRFAWELAQALAHAHGRGLIHRDLKPDNILIDENGGVRLADFGLVRSLYNDSLLDVRNSQCVGTAPYMSPGVAAGDAEDTRCDIYSFGAVLYEMLTGRRPYRGPTAESILVQILQGPPPPIRSIVPNAPEGLVRIAEGAMARELRDRYASMVDVIVDLEQVREGRSPREPHGAESHRSLVEDETKHSFENFKSRVIRLDGRLGDRRGIGCSIVLSLSLVLLVSAIPIWYLIDSSSMIEQQHQFDSMPVTRKVSQEVERQHRLKEEYDKRLREKKEEMRRQQEAKQKHLEEIRMAEEAREREYREAVAREEAEIDQLKSGAPQIWIAPLEMIVNGELPVAVSDAKMAEAHYCLGRIYLDLDQKDEARSNLISAQEYYERCGRPHMVRRVGEFLEGLD